MSLPALFHVSEDLNIRVFEPRSVPQGGLKIDMPVVWAIDEGHIVNYLLPRDCPRVTFAQGANTTAADMAHFLPQRQSRVVVIEEAWLDRVMQATIYLYRIPPEGFEVFDAGAGYWVSRKSVVPLERLALVSGLDEIRKRGAEFRTVKSLWPLRDEVAQSTLEFSIIRMRNAQPRAA